MTTPQRTTSDLVAIIQQDAQNVADPDTFLLALAAHATARPEARGRQRRLLPAVAAAVVALVAIAAVLVTTGHARQRLTPAQPTPTAEPEGITRNRQLTTAETIRLVGMVNLPPGSSATTVQPSSLTMPAGGTPVSTSLIDTVRYWRVPLSYPQAVAWMATHQPAGLRPSGTAGPTGSQTLFSGYVFDAPASNAWEQASLAIGIEPSASGGTAWRVDGMALWLDPRPVPDTITGGRLQVTVAGGCPSSDNGANDVTNTAPGLTASLLPSGSPSAALLCEYNSAGSGHPFALTRHRLLSAAEADHLAELARAVSLAHVDNGPHNSCPAGDPGPIALALRYPDGSNVALWVTPWICGGVSNGTIVAGAFNHPTVDKLLAAIRAATG